MHDVDDDVYVFGGGWLLLRESLAAMASGNNTAALQLVLDVAAPRRLRGGRAAQCPAGAVAGGAEGAFQRPRHTDLTGVQAKRRRRRVFNPVDDLHFDEVVARAHRATLIATASARSLTKSGRASGMQPSASVQATSSSVASPLARRKGTPSLMSVRSSAGEKTWLPPCPTPTGMS